MIRIGILGSTRGSSMLPIIAAIQERRLAATINIVISNKSDALILANAAKYHLPTQFMDPANLSRDAYDQALSAALHARQVDLVVLIGYMRILSSQFVREWQNKIINVHPSLLPAFAGGMDMAVHQAVIAAGVSESGCTVHLVTDDVDAGPILLQKRCAVAVGETAASLKAKVQVLEGEALVEALGQVSS